jgi:hypothetical protein
MLRRRPHVAVLIAVGLVAGCSDVALQPADRAADDRARRAGIVMGRVRDGTAQDMVHLVVGGDPEDGTAIEALVADGDPFRGRIVLRITEVIEPGDFSVAKRRTVRCYEYALDNSIDDHEPEHIDCPDVDGLQLGAPTTQPQLGQNVESNLRRELEALDRTGLLEQQVREAARRAAGDATIVDVQQVGGNFGVAIGNGIDQCVSAMLSVDVLEIWRVPRVLAQPGELGCSASAAARGEGRQAPH